MASQGASMQMKMQCLFQFLSKPPLIDKSSKLEKLIQVMFFNQYLVISFTNIRYRYQGTSLKCNLTRSLSENIIISFGWEALSEGLKSNLLPALAPQKRWENLFNTK